MAKRMHSKPRPHGHKSIFGSKSKGRRYQGVLTEAGSKEFESARARLATLAKRTAKTTSDADVMEFLSRGEAATVAYLEVFGG